MLGFKKKKPYRIGVALSGGGARGFSHAGALQAMEDVGMKPDIIAGVSAGSVAAVMYAAGRGTEELVKLFQTGKFTDFAEVKLPRTGFFSLDRFRSFIKESVAPYENLEDLPIKTVIGVTNLDRGRREKFETGPIAAIVAASCSIPIVFEPARLNGERYVDGGVLRNLPSWTIRDRCKYLIGVNCSPLTHGAPKDNLLNIALRSYELMAKSNTSADMEMCDMAVMIDEVARRQVFDLKHLEQVYDTGYREMMNHLLYYGFKRKL